MTGATRRREKRRGNARGEAPHTLTVYLSDDDRAALKRVARDMQLTDSYAARLAIREYCRQATAREIESPREDAPLFRRMQQS